MDVPSCYSLFYLRFVATVLTMNILFSMVRTTQPAW